MNSAKDLNGDVVNGEATGKPDTNSHDATKPNDSTKSIASKSALGPQAFRYGNPSTIADAFGAGLYGTDVVMIKN